MSDTPTEVECDKCGTVWRFWSDTGRIDVSECFACSLSFSWWPYPSPEKECCVDRVERVE